MYSKVAQIFAVASMLTFVAALPSPQGDVSVSCGNGGTQQCCNELQDAQSGSIQNLLGGLAGLGLGLPLTGMVGVTCSPILAVSPSCTQQTVCCTGNSFNGGALVGLVSLNCDNINI